MVTLVTVHICHDFLDQTYSMCVCVLHYYISPIHLTYNLVSRARHPVKLRKGIW